MQNRQDQQNNNSSIENHLSTSLNAQLNDYQDQPSTSSALTLQTIDTLKSFLTTDEFTQAKKIMSKLDVDQVYEILGSMLEVQDYLLQTMSFLSVDELFRVKQISTFWKSTVNKRIDYDLTDAQLTPDERKRFFNLPNFLQYIIYLFLIKKNGKQLVKDLFSTFQRLPIEERAATLFPNLTPEQIQFKIKCVLPTIEAQSDIANVLHKLNILTSEQLNENDHQELLTEYGALALATGLLTYQQSKLFKHSGNVYGPHNNLATLLSANGFKALQLGLLTPEDAVYCQDLNGMLSDSGLSLIKKGFISTKLIASICRQYHPFTMHDLINAQALLDEELISFKHFHPDNKDDVKTAFNLYKNINFLSNPFGLRILRLQFINKDNLSFVLSFAPDLQPLATENGVTALKNGWLVLSQPSHLKIIPLLKFKASLLFLRKNYYRWMN